MEAAIFVESVIIEHGILSEFRGGPTKRRHASVKCRKKARRFLHLQLGRLVSEASGTHHKLQDTAPVKRSAPFFLYLRSHQRRKGVSILSQCKDAFDSSNLDI